MFLFRNHTELLQQYCSSNQGDYKPNHQVTAQLVLQNPLWYELLQTLGFPPGHTITTTTMPYTFPLQSTIEVLKALALKEEFRKNQWN